MCERTGWQTSTALNRRRILARARDVLHEDFQDAPRQSRNGPNGEKLGEVVRVGKASRWRIESWIQLSGSVRGSAPELIEPDPFKQPLERSRIGTVAEIEPGLCVQAGQGERPTRPALGAGLLAARHMEGTIRNGEKITSVPIDKLTNF